MKTGNHNKTDHSSNPGPTLPIVHLIGDPEENYYQLGLKDRELGKKLHHDALTLLKSQSPIIDKFLKIGVKEYLKRNIFQNPNKYPRLKAYAEGMNEDFYDVAQVLMMPELTSAMPQWLPKLKPELLGCSSLMHLNHKKEVVHHRILDFPLKGSYDSLERAVLYEFKNSPRILGFGSIGMPYPSITLTTDRGMSLALHQKFSPIMNNDGLPIFELVEKLAQYVKSSDDVIPFLKEHHSFTTWCLNMAFKNGDVLSVDVAGKDYFLEKFHLTEDSFLYFNNKLLDPSLNQKEILPYGFHFYNEMREHSAHKKIELMKKLEIHQRTDEEILKIFTTPLSHQEKNKKNTAWSLDTITPSSLQVMSLNLANHQSHYLTGPAPKVFNHNILSLSEQFRHPQQKLLKTKGKVDIEYSLGLEELMNAQKALDHDQYSQAYHSLQMSMDHFSHSSDKKFSDVVKFFFVILQFLHDDHKKVRTYLRVELNSLENKLPSHLEDHRLLFIARINYLLDGSFGIEEDKIDHPRFKKLLDQEAKIPKIFYWRMLKNFVSLRFDIVDIIYLHSAS